MARPVLVLALALLSVLAVLAVGATEAVRSSEDEFVAAPGGRWVHRSCVHHADADAHISHLDNGNLLLYSPRSGEAREIPRCAFPYRFHDPEPLHGPAWKTWAQYEDVRKITFLNSTWTTPGMPSNQNGGQILYFWNGVEPGDNSAVLQPVLQWGSTPAGGGNYWAAASWYVSSDHGTIVTSLIGASPGDNICGLNVLYHNGTWLIQSINTNTGETTQFWYAPFSRNYTYAYHVLEAYSVNNECDLYPPSGDVPFFDIAVEAGYESVVPDWQTDTKDNECNEETKIFNPETLTITFNTSSQKRASGQDDGDRDRQ